MLLSCSICAAEASLRATWLANSRGPTLGDVARVGDTPATGSSIAGFELAHQPIGRRTGGKLPPQRPGRFLLAGISSRTHILD